MRIAWISFHREGFPALQALLEGGVRVEAILTQTREQLAQRSGAVDYSSLSGRFGVPLHRVRKLNHPDSAALLADLSLDVAFVLGWSEIIHPPALTSCRLGMIGAHASLLPHNRGSAPVNWALIRGETHWGNTLQWLADSVDAGDVIDQTAFPVSDYDTCATVYEKVAESNRDMVLRLIPRLLAGQRPGRPQPTNGSALLPRRRPEDGRIDWSQDSQAIYNFIRALTRPYPGAFTLLDGRQWRVWQAALFPGAAPSGTTPGEILGPVLSPCPDACGLAVACGRGVVILLELEDGEGRILRGPELSSCPWLGKVFTHA